LTGLTVQRKKDNNFKQSGRACDRRPFLFGLMEKGRIDIQPCDNPIPLKSI
jgi:hypothetical protein